MSVSVHIAYQDLYNLWTLAMMVLGPEGRVKGPTGICVPRRPILSWLGLNNFIRGVFISVLSIVTPN